MKRLRASLTYSNIMVTVLAVIVIGGGGAYAATAMLPKNSVGTKQIRKGAVTPAKLSKAAKQKLTGATGPQGPKGDKGEPGPSTGLAGGALTGDYPNPALGASVVGASNLAANSVTSTAIASEQVRASDLGPIVEVSNSTSIPHGTTGSAVATCPAGTVVLAGGNDSDFEAYVVASRKEGNGWVVYATDPESTGASTLETHAYCLEK